VTGNNKLITIFRRAGTTIAANNAKLAVDEGVPRIVGWWMGGIAGMAFGAVVLGGVTRLTESGLSMVDWKLFGRKPPTTLEEWEVEFEKYKQSPEYKYKHTDITLEDFKFIWWMEYGHRMWGRTIGAFYYIPAGIMWAKGMFSPAIKKRVIVGGGLLLFQGLLGWYMVKSGLDPKNFEGPNDIPRVSQYRLAAHLSSAMVLYTFLLWNSFSILLPPLQSAKNVGIKALPALASLRKLAMSAKGLVFLTAVSGAFVAGLDAGLTYNSFPLMAGRFIPSDLFAYSPWLSNFTENPTTVQFDHRILGTSTLAFVTYLALKARKLPLHPRAMKAVTALTFFSWMQVGLGITTLLTYVPVSIAALHQANALVTLSSSLWLSHELKNMKYNPNMLKVFKHIPK